MPYKPAIEGLDFFKNFSLTTGDARWLRLHGENSSQDADINLFNAGARLGQSEAGKDFAVWRHATWDGATPSDQYIKIGFDGGGSPYAHIKTDSVYRGINIEGLQVYSESGRLMFRQYRHDIDFNPYEAANMAMLLGPQNVPCVVEKKAQRE